MVVQLGVVLISFENEKIIGFTLLAHPWGWSVYSQYDQCNSWLAAE